MQSIIERLKQEGIVTRKGVNSALIENMSLSKIIDLASSFVSEVEMNVLSPTQSIFVHSASYSLGGGDENCINLECRLSKVNELLRFALMYSDKVYIRNYFADYEHLDISVDENFIRGKFHNDVYVFRILAPFLKNGSVALLNPKSHFCLACLTASALGENASKKLSK